MNRDCLGIVNHFLLREQGCTFLYRVCFNMKMNFVVYINLLFYLFSDLVPIKRESSRRKAKEGNLAKKHMQERLLEDDEEGGLPGKYLK